MVVLCSLGTKDPDGKTAELGCHGSSKFKGTKELRTVGYLEKHTVGQVCARLPSSIADACSARIGAASSTPGSGTSGVTLRRYERKEGCATI